MTKKKEATLIENYNHLKSMFSDSEKDIIKNFEKGNYSAGQRFRKVIKEAKLILTVMRKQTLEASKKNN